MTHDVTVALSVLGVVGQVLVAAFAVVGFLALVGVRGPLAALRGWVEGYELWLAFVVSAVATGGSLFFSEIANYFPCELCWFQRICMYPLSIVTLLAALRDDTRVARYLLPLPIVGAGVSVYHLLVEQRRGWREPFVSDLRPRRVRDQVDQRVRLHDDPHAGADRLPTSARVPATGDVR